MFLFLLSASMMLVPASWVDPLPIDKNNLTINGESDCSEYNILVGDVINIELPSNPSTRYAWYLDVLDKEYFKIIGEGYRTTEPFDPTMTGQRSKQYWMIRALKTGKKSIHMLYYGSWDGERTAIKQFGVGISMTDLPHLTE
jgi:predicted secreted protein